MSDYRQEGTGKVITEEQLINFAKGSGVPQVTVGTTTYKIMGTKLADQMVTPMVNEIDAMGVKTTTLIPDTESAFRLYELDEKGNVKIENGKPVLNYGAWQATTQK